MTEQDKTNDTVDIPDTADTVDSPATGDANTGDANTGDATTEPAATEKVTRPRTKSARTASRSAATASDTGDGDTADAAGDETSAGPVASAPASAKPAGRQLSVTVTSRGLVRVLVALIAVAAVVGVCLLGWGYHQQREKLAAFDDSKAASANFALKMVSSFNTDQVGDMKEVLGPLTTGEFHDRLAKEQTDSTKALQDLDVKATPTVKSVGVEHFDTDSARTNVLVSVTGSSKLSPSGGQQMTLLWLDLRKVDGKWLVSSVDGAQADVGQSASDAKQQAQQQQQQTPAPAPSPAPGG
ncbi:hypothetical protein ACWDTI_05775 [Gordonia sp. NPDC003424]